MTRARLKLLVVAALFVAPVLLAYVLYFSGWRPESVRLHGELVTPARPVADVELSALDGAPLSFSALRERWLLLYFGSSECAAPCERALYKMRQVIAAQGRQAGRVRAAVVLTDRRGLKTLSNQLKDYPDVIVLTGRESAVARLAHEFELSAGGAMAGLHRIYVVDPLGNFMMSYPADADPSGMHKDLTRLLRVSQIG